MKERPVGDAPAQLNYAPTIDYDNMNLQEVLKWILDPLNIKLRWHPDADRDTPVSGTVRGLPVTSIHGACAQAGLVWHVGPDSVFIDVAATESTDELITKTYRLPRTVSHPRYPEEMFSPTAASLRMRIEAREWLGMASRLQVEDASTSDVQRVSVSGWASDHLRLLEAAPYLEPEKE